jgi:hypothetical protein
MTESGMCSSNFLTYDDAWLFCITSTHKNKYDWRMMTQREFILYKPRERWFEDTVEPHLDGPKKVLPVRDIND